MTGWVRVSLGLSCRWQKIQVKELTCWCQRPRCTGKGWGRLGGGPLLATVAQLLSSRRDAGSQHQQRCRQSLTPVCGHNSCPEARPGSSDSRRSSGADGRFWFIRGLPGRHPRGEGGNKGDLKCPHREAAALALPSKQKQPCLRYKASTRPHQSQRQKWQLPVTKLLQVITHLSQPWGLISYCEIKALELKLCALIGWLHQADR